MKRNKALTAIFVAGCIAVVAIAGIVTLFAKDNFGNKTQICDGVSIGSIDVGGLTKEQAQKQGTSKYKQQKRTPAAGIAEMRTVLKASIADTAQKQ